MMRRILRKLRGALGTAVTWAFAWAVAGTALTGVLFLFESELGFSVFFEVAPWLALVAGGWGFVGGAVFSVALGTVFRRRRLEELSVGRMAFWGGLAGALLPLTVMSLIAAESAGAVGSGMVAWTTAVFAGLGATTAGGTVRMAQGAAKEVGGPGAGPSLGAGA